MGFQTVGLEQQTPRPAGLSCLLGHVWSTYTGFAQSACVLECFGMWTFANPGLEYLEYSPFCDQVLERSWNLKWSEKDSTVA